MNKWHGIGRLTADPEIRYTNGQNGQTMVARFTVACYRKYKKDGEQSADFINCVAFGKPAEILEKYFHIGEKIAVCGRITTGKYTNRQGATVYTTDITVEEVEFVESKKTQEGNSQPRNNAQMDMNGFISVPDNVDDDSLPFN